MLDRRTIRRIFEDVLHLEPADRSGYLDRVCTDDDTRQAVDRLLAADTDPGPLDSGLSADGVRDAIAAAIESDGGPGAPAMTSSLVGQTIDRYRILSLIARGGMGEVYEAEQTVPRRRVALKVLHRASLTPGAITRFRHEAEVLARLEHPNIARLYDAGTVDLGLGAMPWIAMELVPAARPITQHAHEAELGIDERLRLFAIVCDAVHHGHRKGFIHRDLKPGNILVGDDGVPRVIDFGVARAIDNDLSIATLHTMAGQLIGSLRYMSPEQCAADPDAIDVRSDVYALGVVLYELLTGQLPYDLDGTTSIIRVPRVICETAPRRPTLVEPQLRGDVETIVLRCLAKNPDERYDNAAALARDLRHHLAQEPIEARRDRTAYMLRRLAQRHRPAVAIATVSVAAVTIALVASLLLWRQSERQRLLADTQTIALRHQNYAGTIALARAALNDDNTPALRSLLDSCPEDLRHWEWWHLNAIGDDSIAVHETSLLACPEKPRYTTTRPPAAGRFFDFAMAPAARLAVIGGEDGQVHLWDLETKSRVRTFDGLEHAIRRVAITPDGRRIAAREARTITEMSRFAVWDAADGTRLAGGEARDLQGVIALSPDGRICAVGSGDVVLLHDVDADREQRQLTAHGTRPASIVFSPDGRRVTASGLGMFAAWDVATGNLLWQSGQRMPSSLAHSPDGTSLAIARNDGSVTILVADDGSVQRVVHRSATLPRGITFSSDGTHIASASSTAIDIWESSTGHHVQRLHSTAGLRGDPVYLDDATIAIGGDDGRLREFGVVGQRARRVVECTAGAVDGLVAIPDSPLVAFAGRRRVIQLIDIDDGSMRAAWPAHGDGYRVYEMAVSPDGAMLASGGEDRMIRLWSLPEGRAVATLGPAVAPIIDVDWTPDGTHVFGATREGRIDVWAVAPPRFVESFEPGQSVPPNAEWYASRSPRTFAIAPRGDLVATSGHEQVIRLWHWPGWREAGTLDGHSELVRKLEFDPSGHRLVSIAHDGSARIWDVATLRSLHMLGGHDSDFVTDVAVSPDGRRTATVENGRWVRVWDMTTGRALVALTGPADRFWNVTFTGDGRHVVATDGEGHVMMFDAPGFEPTLSSTTRHTTRRVTDSRKD